MALEGGVGVRASTFGALRFLGARTALGLQLGAGYTTTAFEAPGTDSLVPAVERGEVRSTSTYAAATLGVRRYGPVRGALAGFAGLGATVRAYASQSGRAHGDEHAVGAVLEGGAAYLVARHLSVNASATASLVRTRGQQRGEFGPVQRTYGYDASLGQVGVSATLFF